jgi:hypothetical protein
MTTTHLKINLGRLKHSCVDHFRTEGVVPNIKHLNHQFLKPLVTLGQGGVHLALSAMAL